MTETDKAKLLEYAETLEQYAEKLDNEMFPNYVTHPHPVEK